MTLTEFNDLCIREWSDACGDVLSLSLTDESREELIDDSMRENGWPAAELLNPVTRSVVKVTGGAGTDTAEVRRHYGESLATP